ncbi:TetR/AcrR family transcriptional regulator [Kineosporia sp. NBRC 101731]|uniref:TetR/AcrR family transcriptional regulator n=1 Tax=Kineosporia sp. NBRC 101731 TaxID=3032199 RepID=UPI00255350EC|nr:TetR/AcrR family transcriptional regulator [Kineosporia sp. NBRC 101731]
MSTPGTAGADAEPGRNARRRSRTRAALIGAAQQILIEGNGANVSIQAITERADVGLGSFYNHFPGRPELFAAAREDATARFRAWIDERIGEETDPVRRLTLNIRLTGRFAAAHPDVSRVLLSRLADPDVFSTAIAPGLHRDVLAVITAQGLDDDDPDVAVIAVSGAIEAVINAAVRQGPADLTRMADAIARNVLRMLGVAETDLTKVLAAPLPGA